MSDFPGEIMHGAVTGSGAGSKVGAEVFERGEGGFEFEGAVTIAEVEALDKTVSILIDKEETGWLF